MRSIIFIRKIFKKFPLLLISNIFLLFLANLIDTLSIFSLVVVVDLFINSGTGNSSIITKKIVIIVESLGLPATLGWLLVFFLLFNILKVTFQIFAQYSILKTKYAFLRDIIIGTFEDFFNARWHFFSTTKQGTLINTFTREIIVLGDAFGAMGRYFSGILQIILYLVVPFVLSWQVALVSIISALIFALPFFCLGRVSYRLGKLNTSTANQIGSVIQENLGLAKLILGFGSQHKGVDGLGQAFDAHRSATLKSQTLNFAFPLMYFPFGILVLIIGFFVARRLDLPLSETAVLFYALARIVPLVGNLTEQKSSLDNFFPSYEQITGLRQLAKELKQETGTRIFKGFHKEIAIENLTFAYPNHQPVLNNINMAIPKGKMIAVVGESGSGKSTLIDIVMGFYLPTEGRIIYDGAALQEFDILSYRRCIGYVPQDSVLFNMSIRDNLLWAYESATDSDIRQACQLACAEEFIQKLPQRYDTVVGERGLRLSGGQVQRIALARAILRKPQLLILDEATSALDTHSERLIQQAIENITGETTVIVVAHRLSTIINADYIYVLKNSRIIEEGLYFELVRLNGDFSRMVRLQALETEAR